MGYISLLYYFFACKNYVYRSKVLLIIENNMYIRTDNIGQIKECKLPNYVGTLLKYRSTAYYNYKEYKTEANKITFLELDKMCKSEVNAFMKNGTVNEPTNFAELQHHMEDLITAYNRLYTDTKESHFLELLGGVTHIRNIAKEVKEMKLTQFNNNLINEYFANLEITN